MVIGAVVPTAAVYIEPTHSPPVALVSLEVPVHRPAAFTYYLERLIDDIKLRRTGHWARRNSDGRQLDGVG